MNDSANKVTCPECKGKGYLFDASSLMLTVIFPVVWLAERSQSPADHTMTKKWCWKCKGKGWIQW